MKRLMCWLKQVLGWCTLLLLVTVALNAQQVKVQWTAGDTKVQWHEVRTIYKDITPEFIQSTSIRVDMPTLTATIPRPRTGHFDVEVRACMKDANNATVCSTWTRSNVQGEPEPWTVFFKPGAPSDVHVN